MFPVLRGTTFICIQFTEHAESNRFESQPIRFVRLAQSDKKSLNRGLANYSGVGLGQRSQFLGASGDENEVLYIMETTLILGESSGLAKQQIKQQQHWTALISRECSLLLLSLRLNSLNSLHCTYFVIASLLYLHTEQRSNYLYEGSKIS